jgi:hypothetical protein
MKSIKGISIRQPWIDLIIKGQKNMEIRKTLPHDGMPKYLLIHSPQKIDFLISRFYGYDQPWTLLKGHFVAIVKVERVIVITIENQLDFLYSHRQPFPLSGEHYGISFSIIKILDEPIEAKGHLDFFSIPSIVLNEIHKNYDFS